MGPILPDSVHNRHRSLFQYPTILPIYGCKSRLFHELPRIGIDILLYAFCVMVSQILRYRNVLTLFLFSNIITNVYGILTSQKVLPFDDLDLDLQTDDYFGHSIDIYNDTAIIGAHYDDDQGIQSGTAYIFKYNVTSWIQIQTLVPNEGDRDDYFGSSVAISNATAIVGAPLCDQSAGAAYVFEYDGALWVQTQRIQPINIDNGDRFSYSISLSHNTAVFGAYGDDDKGSNAGAVYVFENDGSSWIEIQKLVANDGTQNDRFGVSVSISNDILVVGADRNNEGIGAVYVFENNGTWHQIQKLKANDTNIADWIVYSVSVSNDVLIIGAYTVDSYSGAAYMFQNNGTTWNQIQRLVANDRAIDDYFGYRVAISDNMVIVSAYGADPESVYIFAYDGSLWVQTQKLIANDGDNGDYFGISFAIFEDILIICADRDADAGWNAGSAYVFQNNENFWIQTQKLLPVDMSVNRFGSHVSITRDVAVVTATNIYRNSVTIIHRNETLWNKVEKIEFIDNIGSVSASNTMIFIGFPSVASVHVLQYNGALWTELQVIVRTDKFGSSVSIFNNIAIISDKLYNKVYIFEYNDTLWNEVQILVPEDGVLYDYFGCSISIFNDTIIIGAESDDNKGSVYIFQNNGVSWNQTQKLAPNDIGIDDAFGHTVCVSNNVAIIGSLRNRLVYIYEYNGVLWNEMQQLLPPGNSEQLPIYFGNAVSICNNLAIIGAYNTIDSGAVYIFHNNGVSWDYIQTFTDDNDESIGYSVSISDDVAIIGAPYIYDSERGHETGAVYVLGNISPTAPPTAAPTAPPTAAPTAAPSAAPTVPPTAAPTAPPTAAPTAPPTAAPTADPTEPTVNPTFTYNPTTDPTSDPTTAPTSTPTTAPTSFPSTAPTGSPSQPPTLNPTKHPTKAPTAPSLSPTTAPTVSPTTAPTVPPTVSPSVAPSYSPSRTPSIAPSIAPTRAPISSTDFDYYIFIIYELINLNTASRDKFRNNITDSLKIITETIKYNYFDVRFLPYSEFMVTIQTVNGVEIQNIDENAQIKWENAQKLAYGTKIECDTKPINYCELVKQKSQPQNEFTQHMTDDLSAYFDNDNVGFNVQNAKSLEIICKDCVDEAPNYIFYGLVTICGILILCAVCAFLFNKGKFPTLPGFHVVDNGKWAALMVFALQFWDFSSDINLSVEMWSHDHLNDDILILITAIGSTLFILIPYIANLIIAARIKNIIRGNEAAKSWFQSNTAIFTILVVLTGGCYPALALISSGIFGLQILSSGLTLYELKKLSKIKVFGTVFLENVPQLIVQSLYSYAINVITDSVKVAFFASLLSVTAATLGYLIDRDSDDIKVADYYLFTQCDTNRSPDTDDIPMNEEEGDGALTQDQGQSPSEAAENQTAPTPIASDQITAEEKQNLMVNRGRTLALSEGLAELFGIPPKNIEIGYSTITKYGVITHIVHYISKMELDSLQQELHLQNEDVIVTAPYYAHTLFLSMKQEITAIFIRHFGLNGNFQIKFMNQMAGETVKVRRAIEYRNEQQTDILRRMMTHTHLAVDDDDQTDIGDAMSQWLRRRGFHPTQDLVNNMVKSVWDNEKRHKCDDLEQSVSLSFSDNENKEKEKENLEVEMIQIQSDSERKESVNDENKKDVSIKEWVKF